MTASTDNDKSLTDLSALIVAAVNGVTGAVKNGSNWALDLPALMTIVADSQVLLGEDGNVIPDIKSLSEAQAATLITGLMTGLSVTNTKAVAIINAALQFAASGYALYQAAV